MNHNDGEPIDRELNKVWFQRKVSILYNETYLCYLEGDNIFDIEKKCVIWDSVAKVGLGGHSPWRIVATRMN